MLDKYFLRDLIQGPTTATDGHEKHSMEAAT
jgi:hypothetical protein